MSSRYTKAWLIWLGIVVVGFGVIEGFALASGDMSGTLTAHLRLWLGQDPHRPWGIAAGIAVLVGLVWLAYHLLIDRDKKGPGPR